MANYNLVTLFGMTRIITARSSSVELSVDIPPKNYEVPEKGCPGHTAKPDQLELLDCHEKGSLGHIMVAK